MEIFFYFKTYNIIIIFRYTILIGGTTDKAEYKIVFPVDSCDFLKCIHLIDMYNCTQV